MFWAVAALLALCTTAPLVWAVLASRTRAAERAEVRMFKDQLAEVDSDLSRGVITADDADALRTEVSRRLLNAADQPEMGGAPSPKGASRFLALVISTFVVAGGGLLYNSLGTPALPDQPLAKRLADNAARHAERPSQSEVEAMLDANGQAPRWSAQPDPTATRLLDQLRNILIDRPGDLRGHRLLAGNLANLGQWREAAVAQKDVLRILDAEASGSDYADLAEYQILAVNGYVSPQAEAALAEALLRYPNEPRARYYSGLSALQAGRVDLTYDLWLRLLVESPEDAPWMVPIRSQIGDVALAANRPVPPGVAPPTPGPSAEDLAAAEALSPEERRQMVRDMVAQLSDRLATDGGPAGDWARLIRALGVLGERGRASAIWAEAAERFADAPVDLSIIRQAARDAEVVQ
ncbi:MAG: c-type cytochrome biogenesis protein CcmI [Pseudomonadota bacterium]